MQYEQILFTTGQQTEQQHQNERNVKCGKSSVKWFRIYICKNCNIAM